MIWDSSRINVLEQHIGSHYILIHCYVIGSVLEWIFSSIYGHVRSSDKNGF